MAVSHWAEVLESNVNVANNTSTVTLRVHIITSGESHNYNEQLGNTYIYTPGENKFWRRYTLPYDTDTIVDSVVDGVAHNNDGSKTITWSYSLPTGISAGTLEGSGSATLTKIPRQTSITSFTVSKINETSLKFNWQTSDTIDYAWYSTNNGSTWTGVDVTDGTSGNFNVSSLSPGTSYNCKIRVRRKDSQLTTDSSTVVQSTYAAPTQSLISKTETSITMKWTLDTTADYIWYSKDNGTNWTAVGSVNATSGNYTITGLTANTTYNIRTRVRRKSSQTTYNTANSAIATYDYPKVSGVGTSNLLIGDTQALTLYNPLSRSVTVKMYQNNTSGTELYSGTTSGTSISFTPVLSTLYASIPNSTSGNCVYSVIYGNSTKTTTQYTYSIRGTETPIFSNFTYADTSYASKTGNNQVLVQGLSNLRVTISNENKMIARHSASGNKYTAACENRSGQVDYSSTENVTIDLGTIDTSGTKAISVSAYDSRNLYTTVVQEALVVPYSKPTIVSSATRLNNFENQTTLKVNGVFSKVTVDEVDKNTITNVKYRVREVGGEWGSLTAITFTTNDNRYTCSDVTLDLDNTKSFEIEVQTTDTMEQVTTGSVIVNIGIPSFFIKKTGGFESYGDSEVSGALSVSGNETVGGKVEVVGKTTSGQGFTVKHLSGGAGTGGYMAVCDLKITGSWENQWIIFHTIQRGRHGKIYLIFNPVSSTDPSLSAFRKIGSVNAYIAKTATSTWRLFIQKTESYDDIEITNLEKGTYSEGIQLTWVNETVTSLPSGYTEAVLLTIDMIATNADIINATTSNPTTETAYNIPFMSGTGGRLSLYGNTGLSYSTREGTTSTNGLGIVIAGNNTAQGTAGNKKGYMRIYGNGSYFTQIDCNPTANRGVTIPNVGGTMVVNGGISDGGNGWYKVNMGAYTMYFSSGSIASSSYGANSWGTKEFSFPTGVTFNSAKMAFSGTAYADDRAVSYNFGIYNGNAKVVIAWKNQWSGTVTTTGRYNFILYVFP